MSTRLNERLSQTWDLDVFFPGGSDSPEFRTYLDALETDIATLRERVMAWKDAGADSDADVGKWSTVLERVQDIERRLRQAAAFTSCLTAQNVKDEKAKLLEGRVQQIGASFASVNTVLDERILQVPQPRWERLLADERLRSIAFPLAERRHRAAEKLPPEQEALAVNLAVDGYHGWSELYNTVVGRMAIPLEQDGKTVRLSVGQAFNKLSDPDRALRTAVFAKWEEAWAAEAELCASALNHLAGFRLNLYRQRAWGSVLKEPVDVNRMTETTLNVMWDVIDRNKDRFVAFLRRKARVLGLDALTWHDVSAPLTRAASKVDYDGVADFIIEQFGRFSPRMADFARRAFVERWIEAEDRPGKRPGGFCTSFPDREQSRIFMTFSGVASNLSTLAHELGHAYHQDVMDGLPTMVRRYAMNVAETASTFAEMIVSDAAVKHASSDEERLALLEDKIQRSIGFFMNIHARFLFETRFYDAREKGPVSVGHLNDLMLAAQKEAYRDALADYHPHFWASKLHFYITYVPFYNFPYTFGYLFSSGVYARALAEGPGFGQKYVDLLRDTGRMTVEDLAARHLGVDLTQPDFWQSAIDLSLADVDEFLRLTE